MSGLASCSHLHLLKPVLPLAILAVVAPRIIAQPNGTPVRELDPQTAVSSNLEPGHTDSYSFRSEGNQIIKVACTASGGRPFVSLLSPLQRRFVDPIGVAYRAVNRVFLWQSGVNGTYRLDITAPAYLDNPVSYELRLEAPHDPTAAEKTKLQADDMLRSARAANGRRQFEDALKSYQDALAKYREIQDRAAEEEALREIGLVHSFRNDYQQQLSVDEKTLTLFQEDGDMWGIGMMQNAVGFALFNLRRYDEALRSYSAALESRRLANDIPGQAQTLSNLGLLHRNAARPEEAMTSYQQSLGLYRKVKDRPNEFNVVLSIAFVYEAQARFEEEIKHLDAALSSAREARDRRAELNFLFRRGLTNFSLNRFGADIDDMQRALPIAREFKDTRLTGNILNQIGWSYFREGELQKAREYFEQALPVRRAAKDQEGVAQTLNNLAHVAFRLHLYDDAQPFLDESMKLARESKFFREQSYGYLVSAYLAEARHNAEQALSDYREGVEAAREGRDLRQEGIALRDLAGTLIRLDRPEEAIPELDRSLENFKKLHSPAEQARSSVLLGRAYHMLNRVDRAQECFNDALARLRELKDRAGEASILVAIGSEYRSLNEYDKAIQSYSQAYDIYRLLKSRLNEARALNYLGMVYGDLSTNRAIECLRESLALLRSGGRGPEEVTVLNNLGYRYDHSGNPEKATAYYQEAIALNEGLDNTWQKSLLYGNLAHAWLAAKRPQEAVASAERALKAAQEVKDRYRQTRALAALGNALEARGSRIEAMQRMEEALALARKSPDAAEAARVWKDMARIWKERRDYPKAVSCLEAALAGYRIANTRQFEADTLGDLSSVWSDAGQKRLAVVYAKQGVNVLQSIRTTVQPLEQDLQEGFLAKNEKYYRDLADLLISLARLPEAREVLDLLKHEEYREFVGRSESQSPSASRKLAFTAEEREFADRYEQVADKLVSLGRRRSELMAKPDRSPSESKELGQLDADLEVGNEMFHKKLDEIAATFTAKPEAAVKMNMLRESQAFKDDLAELQHGAVVIYTVVTDSRYRAILVTPSVQKAYEYPINSTELSKKIFEFREALQNPKSNPVPLAQELYKVIIGPRLSEDLRQAGAKTLMWSLDGVLRFVPLAALHDGTRYMAERYQQVIFTPASNARWKDVPKSNWQAVAFGVTKPHDNFPPLPEVATELNGIVGPVLQGRALIDEAFTAPAMKEVLRQRFPVVHVASHFRFQPGNKSASFLLLGDGTHLTLSEMERMENLFSGVDLLTLSACETGVGDVDSNGREVEGLGVLAQRQGAKAVVATLWPVADSSTSRLMQEFYRWRLGHPGLTKAEALQHAQLTLLNGSDSPEHNEGGRGAKLVSGGSPQSPVKYSHPYFWAPFFLMGNWL